MRHTVLFLTIVLVIAAIDTGANAAAVRVASVDYVDNATITLESTLNKVDTINADATDTQYPSATTTQVKIMYRGATRLSDYDDIPTAWK